MTKHEAQGTCENRDREDMRKDLDMHSKACEMLRKRIKKAYKCDLNCFVLRRKDKVLCAHVVDSISLENEFIVYRVDERTGASCSFSFDIDRDIALPEKQAIDFMLECVNRSTPCYLSFTWVCMQNDGRFLKSGESLESLAVEHDLSC